MSLGRIEPELATLRKLAQQLAKERVEPVTSVHWLAAISLHPGAGRDLLAERQIDSARIFAAISGRDEDTHLIRTATESARHTAISMDAPHTGGLHLLISFLGETSSCARRTLTALKVDPLKLRTSALQLGMGLRQRPTSRTAEPASRAAEPRSRAAEPVPLLQQRSNAEEPKRTEGPTRTAPARTTPPRLASSRSTAVAVPLVPKPLAARQNSKVPAEIVSLVPSRSRVAKGEKAEIPAETQASQLDDKQAPLPAASVPVDLERFTLKKSEFPALNSYGKNLTLLAAQGQLEPFVGREAEIDQLLDILAKRNGRSPCLVGSAGIGKSALVRGLAQSTAQSSASHPHDARLIVEVSFAELLQGCQQRGMLAGRLGALRAEVEKSGRRVVLFFDELTRLFNGESADEAYAELKLLLAQGMPCIGTSTLEDFRRFVETDRALSRHFSLVEVEEPCREDAFLILRSVASSLAEHHHVSYSDEALALSVAWSVRYLPGRALPEKAIAILDLAGARTKRRSLSEVLPEQVAEVVSEQSEVPIERLLQSDHERMLNLEQLLAERVVGHTHELNRISRLLRRNAAGLSSRRPIGTFLLLGPTGVGKTETAKAVAEVLFQSDNAMTRIDLSEYGEAHSVARLIGSPPGYIGHDAGGQLTEAVRKRPYQVVLLDEIEKAHPDVLTTFLGVFDEGRLTDGRGRTVDFTNVVLMLTSNIGSRETAQGPRRVGFGTGDADPSDGYEGRMLQAARDVLLPELYNRIDEVLAFRPLSRERVSEIATRLLNKLALDLRMRHQITLEFGADVVQKLLDLGGYDPLLGARPLKRAIARHIEAPLAEELLKQALAPGDAILLQAEESGIGFDTVAASAAE